jgi:hypothetical protein
LVYTSNIRTINLTCLRGLEVAELKEEDMPIVTIIWIQKKSFCYSFLKTNKRYEILNKSAPIVIIWPPNGQCWILNKPPIIHIESDKFFNLSTIILNFKFNINI